jgi:hypothetical protein
MPQYPDGPFVAARFGLSISPTDMKRSFPWLPALLAVLLLPLTGCEVIGDIFKAGAWTGAIGVILVIVLLIWLVSRLFRR